MVMVTRRGGPRRLQNPPPIIKRRKGGARPRGNLRLGRTRPLLRIGAVSVIREMV